MICKRPTAPMALCAIALVGGCASNQRAERPDPPSLMPWEEFEPAPARDVWLGGQPSERALDEFAARGGRFVINLRTDEEMAYLPYYDRAVTARGLAYARVPTSGSTLGAATYEAMADALARHDGPIMLHCASGKRATYAWAMRRIADEGLTAEEAIGWATRLRGETWEAGAEKLRAFEDER